MDAVHTLVPRSGQEFFGCYSRGMPWMPAELTTPTDAERQALDLVRVGCGVAHVSVGDMLNASMTPTPQRRSKRQIQPAGAMRSLQLVGDTPAPRSSARARARLEAVAAPTDVVTPDVADRARCGGHRHGRARLRHTGLRRARRASNCAVSQHYRRCRQSSTSGPTQSPCS